MESDIVAGRYRVVRAVGKGGMGTVWLGTDETLHRDVALKQVGSLPGESPDDTARAMREARLAAALNHQNAVSIFDVVEHEGSTWLVMEYVPSQTLSQLLAAEGRLSPKRVAHIGAQVAAALSSAHSTKIVHRDIKPGNILVGDNDMAKISDFGIARGDQDSKLTQTGMVSGTAAFFSPELALGEDPTYASDVWALGITLYTAIEGAPPHQPRANPLAMLSAIAREPVPPPTHAGPLTPVLERMLDPDPGRRTTMSEVLDALQEIERREGVTTPAWGAPAAAAGAAGLTQEPTTSLIGEPVEPEYEKSVTVPAVGGDWADDEPAAAGPPPERERRSYGRLGLAVLAILVVAGLGALLWATSGDGDADPTASNASTDVGGDSSGKGSGEKKSSSPETTRTKSPETTKTEPKTKKTTEPTAEPTTEPTTKPSAGPKGFTKSYFSTVPDDLDTGWSMLAPSFQAELGRGSYDGFWGSIDSVSLQSVEVVDDQTVQYQITYVGDDGTSQETKILTLEPNGDSYLITSDSPAG